MLALGNILCRRVSDKPKIYLSHPVHGELKFFQLALEIHVFKFMTIHMRFEQLGRKHSGATAITDGGAEDFLFILNVVRVGAG